MSRTLLDMRVLRYASLLGAMVIALTSPYFAAAQADSKSATTTTKKPGEFAEIFKLPLANGESLRDRLLLGCANSLEVIKSKHPEDMILGLNCDVARQRAAQDYDNANATPMMLGAWLYPRTNAESILMYDALNTRRETNLLVLAVKMPEGGILQVFYHFIDRAIKDDSLVYMGGNRVQSRLSFAEIQKLGKAERKASGVDIHIDVRGFHAIEIPSNSPMAAAIGDNSGRMSEFVLVHELLIDPTTGKYKD